MLYLASHKERNKDVNVSIHWTAKIIAFLRAMFLISCNNCLHGQDMNTGFIVNDGAEPSAVWASLWDHAGLGKVSSLAPLPCSHECRPKNVYSPGYNEDAAHEAECAGNMDFYYGSSFIQVRPWAASSKG